MKELPRKFKRFIVSHGPQTSILVVGGVALVLGGMFLLGSPVFGLHDSTGGTSDGTKAQVQPSDSIASIKNKDSDKDGLSDLEERLYHTNPNNPDTDGDGYKDGEEVKNGYDPASKLSGGTQASSSGKQSSGSLLSLLNGDGTGGSVSAASAPAGTPSGLGGLGGLPNDQAQALGDAVLPNGQKVADLEVDQVLNKGSAPLPTVDRKAVKTTSDNSVARKTEYFNAVVKIGMSNDPFPPEYTVKKYLQDVEANNREMFEHMKVDAEAMLQEMQNLTVPAAMVDQHLHLLGILMASRDQLQQVLDSNLSSDSILALMGRSFFVMNEFTVFLQDTANALQS